MFAEAFLFGGWNMILAICEDTHPLRLTSKLVDLRVGYANPRCCLWHNDCVRIRRLRNQNKKPTARVYKRN